MMEKKIIFGILCGLSFLTILFLPTDAFGLAVVLILAGLGFGILAKTSG